MVTPVTLRIGPDNRTIVPKLPAGSKVYEPGTWCMTDHGAVMVVCPLCGKTSIIRDPLGCLPRPDRTHGHEIAPDGAVVPSLACPRSPCPWHVYVRLEGWRA